MKIKKWNKFRLVFGSILLLIGLALLVFWKDTDSRINVIILTFLLTLGITTTMRGFLWPKGKFFTKFIYTGPPEEDERTRKIGAFAMAYSWNITAIFIAVLIVLDLLSLLKMNVREVLVLTFCVMMAATVGLYAYFRRKGDVG